MNTTRKVLAQLRWLCAIAFLLCCIQQNFLFAPAKSSERKHRHRAQADMLIELQPGVSFVHVKPVGASEKENIRTSKNRRFIAYTTSTATERLFIKDIKRDVVYEVQGLPLEHRPLSDLEWTSQSRLRFDRWSQPHHGVHYEVDVLQKKLVIAYAFPD